MCYDKGATVSVMRERVVGFSKVRVRWCVWRGKGTPAPTIEQKAKARRLTSLAVATFFRGAVGTFLAGFLTGAGFSAFLTDAGFSAAGFLVVVLLAGLAVLEAGFCEIFPKVL
ncbi:uncharacterized protein PGTG_14114 [Puccinia graminis f. sp. tritici CRL 75-36-700-3]|uniref:Uncharacterized protein n=1 Tax=Puccinia graminis f. sp. tritici (strain CRL 75-36-700-3 / race SCCL) TaxID=418459 RepID=E3KW61_PUCGT|nr:uncharacterized protein PGTG_14114 [Puccinia graminis f. sp. tritici CRL 75-36-700-3]EFP88536.1 hypothetical protein PGTG_14114 [Puccinia graminis f. sp. tritici CRL 75-36-700-3]